MFPFLLIALVPVDVREMSSGCSCALCTSPADDEPEVDLADPEVAAEPAEIIVGSRMVFGANGENRYDANFAPGTVVTVCASWDAESWDVEGLCKNGLTYKQVVHELELSPIPADPGEPAPADPGFSFVLTEEQVAVIEGVMVDMDHADVRPLGVTWDFHMDIFLAVQAGYSLTIQEAVAVLAHLGPVSTGWSTYRAIYEAVEAYTGEDSFKTRGRFTETNPLTATSLIPAAA